MNRLILTTLSLILYLMAGAAKPLTEIRAVWLTTFLGLDWPGTCYNPERQKAMLTQMLDRLAEANFNMVIFQVQANGDVLWDSRIQPAMKDVTGNGSRSMSYDVSKFVIEECHKRGLEVHAWIVPYRLGGIKRAGEYVKNKIQHPYYTQKSKGITIDFKRSRYLDPGNPKSIDYLLDLYKELVVNYNFDGISLDYTRYPGGDFPDAASYKKRALPGESLDDWRRRNVTTFVCRLDSMVKSHKPWMIVGSAPIGTYKKIEGCRNSTAYDQYNQDPGAWIEAGHHDLIVPQMYWGERNGFSTHMTTWANMAMSDSTCHLAIGLAPYRMMPSDGNWEAMEIIEQIRKARNENGVGGVCFFRAEHVVGPSAKAQALYRRLKRDLFRRKAVLPWRLQNEAN